MATFNNLVYSSNSKNFSFFFLDLFAVVGYFILVAGLWTIRPSSIASKKASLIVEFIRCSVLLVYCGAILLINFWYSGLSSSDNFAYPMCLVTLLISFLIFFSVFNDTAPFLNVSNHQSKYSIRVLFMSSGSNPRLILLSISSAANLASVFVLNPLIGSCLPSPVRLHL